MSIVAEITRLQNAKADIKQAIENKGVTVGDGLIDTYAEEINSIQVGSGANFQDFVDAQTGVDTGKTDLAYCFQYTSHEELNIRNETITGLGYCFRGATNLKKIIFKPNATSQCTSFGYAFNGTSNLETIENFDLTSAIGANQTFNNSGVKNITFTGTISFNFNVSTLGALTHDSLVNIINTLLDSASGKTLTLSKKAVNVAFETTEGANDGSTSDEWNALVATRPNWTIALV